MLLRVIGVTLVAIAALASVLGSRGQPAEGHSPSEAAFWAQHSGKCLRVHNGGTGNLDLIVQYQCVDQFGRVPSAQVDVIHTADGWHQIRFRHSGKCLDVPGGSLGYVQLIQYSCHSGDNQKFSIPETVGTPGQIRAKHSGMCLDVASEAIGDAAAVIQFSGGTSPEPTRSG